MKALLRLYPGRWQQRYRAEVEALLEELPRTPRVAIDLIKGALLAHLDAEPTPAGAVSSGGSTAPTPLPMTARSLRLPEIAVHGILLSLLLGAVTGTVWLLVGGREASQGGYLNVVRDDGVLLYGALALASGAIGYLIGRGPWRDRSLRWRFVVIAFAWLVDGVILVVLGRRLADELDPPLAFIAWLIATGVGLQPLATAAGAWLAGDRHATAPASPVDREARAGAR
jgi:hypothetical protein